MSIENILKDITYRITNEVDGINRVLLDLTPKPVGTIEWEQEFSYKINNFSPLTSQKPSIQDGFWLVLCFYDRSLTAGYKTHFKQHIDKTLEMG